MSKDFPDNTVLKDLYKEVKENYLDSLTNCIKNDNGKEILNSKNPQKTMFKIINNNTNNKNKPCTNINELYLSDNN